MSTMASPATTTVVWRDGKKYLWLIGLLIPLLPLIGGGLATVTDLGVFWWTGPIVLYVIVPLLDLVVGRDGNNPPEEAVPVLEKAKYYRWVVYLYLPVQYAALVWGAWLLAGDSLSVVDKFGLTFTLGVVAGVAINTAHELGHKKEEHERWYAKIALAQTCYGHFFIEHNRGHHVRVSTPDDPASSRMGETVWEFMPRTVIGGVRSAWHLEAERMERLGKRTWNWRNDVLNAWAMSLVLFGGLTLAFGVEILPWLAIQAVFGFWLLELVNYLEHYGMRRQQLPSGRFERVTPAHSWNSNNITTNVLLYHLQRHSDHHANPTRRFQALRDFEDAPVLPTGYAGMMVLSWFPPLWRRVMDPLVVAHYDGDITKANLHPRMRERLLAKYPAPAA
ncbi:MAG: alkane 1-monooxygenase [Sporichthyaceae bacterium]